MSEKYRINIYDNNNVFIKSDILSISKLKEELPAEFIINSWNINTFFNLFETPEDLQAIFSISTDGDINCINFILSNFNSSIYLGNINNYKIELIDSNNYLTFNSSSTPPRARYYYSDDSEIPNSFGNSYINSGNISSSYSGRYVNICFIVKNNENYNFINTWFILDKLYNISQTSSLSFVTRSSSNYNLCNNAVINLLEGSTPIPLIQIINSVNITGINQPITNHPLGSPTGASGETIQGGTTTLEINNNLWQEYNGEFVPSSYVAKANTRYVFNITLTADIESFEFVNTDYALYLNGVTCPYTYTWHVLESDTYATLSITILFDITSETEDPYEQGGTSTTGGGDGTFDPVQESNDFPTPINVAYIGSIYGSNMATVYVPTLAEFNNFSSYLWSNTIWSQIQTLIGENAIDILTQRILSHHLLPVNIPTGGTKTVNVGWIPTDISMTIAQSDQITINCGSVTINELWGGYMDYNPYTRIQLFLPYVGYVDLNTDEVMNQSITIEYNIFISTGDFNCMVRVGNSGFRYIGYAYAGNCSMKLPVVGNDTTFLRNAIGLIGAIGAGAIGGLGGMATSQFSKGMDKAINVGKNIASGGSSLIENVTGQKNFPKSTGTISMNSGFLGQQIPFLILQRPRQLVPDKQHKYTGYPSFVTMTLSSCIGYTVVEDINLENMNCTQDEMTEIITLLRTGVII